MTIEESLKLNAKFLDLLSKNLIPTIQLSSNLANAFGPLIEYQAQIQKTYGPLYNMQNQVSEISKQFNAILGDYHKISLSLGQSFAPFIQRQMEITKNLHKLDIDISLAELSDSSSVAISELAMDALLNLETDDLPSEVTDSKEAVLQLTEPKKSLTWSEILIIISFIIQLLTFFQNQLPDKNAEATVTALYEIIEIQSHELDLLKQKLSE
jgi:hypothetical protein